MPTVIRCQVRIKPRGGDITSRPDMTRQKPEGKQPKEKMATEEPQKRSARRASIKLGYL